MNEIEIFIIPVILNFKKNVLSTSFSHLLNVHFKKPQKEVSELIDVTGFELKVKSLEV